MPNADVVDRPETSATSETLETGEVKEDIGVTIEIPGLVNVYKKLWKDPPCYHWVKPLFRLGHGFNS
jgi:hypothetical protein